MKERNDSNGHKDNSRKPERTKAIVNCLLTTAMAIFLIGLMVRCSKSGDTPVPVDRVLMVYLAGDNNLSGESHEKLRAIAHGYDGNPSQRVLIYRDSNDEAACLYEADGKKSYTLVEDYGDENSADPAVFSRVIAKARAMYPQAKFNLLVFSHASGWLPAGALGNPALRSVLVDGDNQMEFGDFASAIPDGMFSLIAFDACYMAGIEVAYQLRSKARYILASSAEVVSPGFTPVYEQHAGDLIMGNHEGFMQAAFGYFDAQTGYMRSSTLSVIDTEGLENLAIFVKQNCDFTKEIMISDIQHFDRGGGYLFCDFVDYYSRLLETDAQKQQLQNLTDRCVVQKAATDEFLPGYNGFGIRAHSGMTSYIPQQQYTKLNKSYKRLDWARVNLAN